MQSRPPVHSGHSAATDSPSTLKTETPHRLLGPDIANRSPQRSEATSVRLSQPIGERTPLVVRQSLSAIRIAASPSIRNYHIAGSMGTQLANLKSALLAAESTRAALAGAASTLMQVAAKTSPAAESAMKAALPRSTAPPPTEIGVFSDAASAQDGYEQTISENSDAIAEWLNEENADASPQQSFAASSPTGQVVHSLHNGEVTAKPATFVVASLERNDNGSEVRVRTAYPSTFLPNGTVTPTGLTSEAPLRPGEVSSDFKDIDAPHTPGNADEANVPRTTSSREAVGRQEIAGDVSADEGVDDSRNNIPPPIVTESVPAANLAALAAQSIIVTGPIRQPVIVPSEDSRRARRGEAREKLCRCNPANWWRSKTAYRARRGNWEACPICGCARLLENDVILVE